MGLSWIAALVLLSPVTSEVPPDADDGTSTGASVCGLTLTHAFRIVSPEREVGDRRADCAVQASDRVGDGLALLLPALPAGFVAAVGQRDRASAVSTSVLRCATIDRWTTSTGC